MKLKTALGRYLLLDGIRGIAIVNMVIFHFLFDVFMVYGVNTQWYSKRAIHIWQQTVCWIFIFIAGMSWRFGRNKWKRGIVLNVLGFLITVVTLIVIPGQTVWFGILSFMGCACLLMIPLEYGLKKIPPFAGIPVFFMLFLLFLPLQQGYLGIGERVLLDIPDFLYRIKILTVFGLPFPDFQSSDYFPVLPWLFLYIAGYFFCGILKENRRLQRIFSRNIPVFTAIGQKGLWIYILHQPLCMGAAAALMYVSPKIFY